MPSRKKSISPARAIALVGISAATVECGKLVLAAIPNVEVVTLLLALYGYAFGYLGVAAALVFVAIEPMIYGFGSWVISYIIYWPLVAVVFMLLGRARIKNRLLLTAVAVGLTLFFSILSSLVDIGLFSGFFDNFFARFFVYYAHGVPFYTAQIVTNAVLFPLLFPFLSDKLMRIFRRQKS